MLWVEGYAVFIGYSESIGRCAVFGMVNGDAVWGMCRVCGMGFDPCGVCISLRSSVRKVWCEV